MTLIAGFVQDGCPWMLGDLIVSRDRGSGVPLLDPVDLPVVNDVNEHLSTPDRYEILGLTQKLCLLSPEVAVAWSGTLKVTSPILLDLREIAVSGRDVTRRIQERMNSIPATDLFEVSMIALVVEDGRFEVIGLGARGVKAPGFETAVASGSGRPFIEGFLGSEAFKHGLRRIPPDMDNAAQRAVVFGSGVTSHFLGQELVSEAGIPGGWGGGFEIATISEGKIMKPPRSTVALAMMQVGTDGKVESWSLPRIYQQAYEGDDLVLRSLKSSEIRQVADAAGSLTFEKRDLLVPPPWRLTEVRHPGEGVAFGQEPLTWSVVIVAPNGRRTATGQYEIGRRDGPALEIENGDSNLEINVRSRAIEDLIRLVENHPLIADKT